MHLSVTFSQNDNVLSAIFLFLLLFGESRVKWLQMANTKMLSNSDSGKRILIFHEISIQTHGNICSVNSSHKFSPDKRFFQAL